MHFVKMQGLGNDFVVLDGPVTLTAADVAALCDRRRGVGADGVLTVTGGQGTVRMEYWNADGSAAEMCGNGLRCVARYAFDRGLSAAAEFVVDTAVGPRRVMVGETVTVELGPVDVGESTVVDGAEFRCASVGNPHAVTFVDDAGLADVAGVGPRVERDPRFPRGTNVEFVTVEGEAELRLRVWERGVGETLACGTGAAAAAAVAHALGYVEESVAVRLPGGEARIGLRDGVAWLSGPAEYAFEGDWPAIG